MNNFFSITKGKLMETIIDKTKTALVVIDLQKGITSMPTTPREAKEIIANAARLAEAFRKNTMPVFLVRVATSADGKDRLTPVIDGENPFANRKVTADWSEIVPELGPKEGDFVITKKQWGAFYGTDLDLQLRRRKIETIVLCGISTNIGVESTARFAYEYGYQQIFAEDASGARTADEHEHTMKTIFPRMGKVRTTQEIISALD
jgi:nicotinamidase-related amidase